jgi:transcriptional regulator with XRE-family HTH domain
MQAALQPSRRASVQPFGAHLRHWRQHRRLSQQALAEEAEVSTRHLSFVETGRSAPSREMVIRLAARLEVPLRERNAMLVAAGYAPMYRERPFDDPELAPARQAVEQILRAHEPWPALAADRHWNLVATNRMLPHLLAGADPALLTPPVNVLRISLDPRGVASSIVNLGQWRGHLLERLRQQVHATGDGVLASLLEELLALPAPPDDADGKLPGEHVGIALPLRLRTGSGEVLNLLSTTTVFGTAVDVTLQELTLETFLPADAQTADALRRLGESLPA